MLTRKYYTMIAKAIKTSNNKQELIDNLCREFKADNCNFDSYKFENACNNRNLK